MKRLKKEKSSKKLLLPILAFVLVGAAATGLFVYALSHSNSVIDGDIPLGGTKVELIEDSDAGFGKKEVSFRNSDESNMPVLLRIGYAETWDNGAVSNTVNGVNVVTKSWTTAFANDFVDGGDGWYYYEKTLAPNETVQVLSSIALTNNSYLAYDYDLVFRYEAIQPTAEAASELWGKTVVVENGVATWAF
ncbi:hypothetical protein IK110_01495 [Candidatus Saccharibacteria bacterium]|nr:hypothetical protein [Candidatus Saccharibacteria bacterium]